MGSGRAVAPPFYHANLPFQARFPQYSCPQRETVTRIRRYFAARLLQLTPVLIEVVLVLGRDFDQGRSGRPPSAAFQS